MAKKQIATFLAPNKGLSIVGDHAYGYSGVLDISTEIDMLSFTTGNFVFVGTIQFNAMEISGEDFLYQFYLNNIVVQGFVDNDGAYAVPRPPTTFINVIIPPNTQVRATAQNQSDSAQRRQVCNITGRIYNV